MNSEDQLNYSYSTKPRAVQTSRSKGSRDARDPQLPPRLLQPNIMHDPRIQRGSVFASLTQPSLGSAQRDTRSKDKPKKRKPHIAPAKNNSIYNSQKVGSYSFTPVSLEANLVEQAPPVMERDVFSQTDTFVRYMAPKKKLAMADGRFQRPKDGVDSSTQMDDTDQLFNFDLEVKPLLNVLVSKILAQALCEVKEEEEMKNVMEERTLLVGNKTESERVDQELEENAKVAFRQKEQKKQEQELKRQRIRVVKKKILAWQLGQRMVSSAVDQASATLEGKGVFYDPLIRDLTQWLSLEVYPDSDAKLNLRGLAGSLLDDLLVSTLRKQSILAHLLPNENDALVRITLRDPIHIATVSGDGKATTTEVCVIGPLNLSRSDSLSFIEKKLQVWIAENVGECVDVPMGGYISLLNLSNSL